MTTRANSTVDTAPAASTCSRWRSTPGDVRYRRPVPTTPAAMATDQPTTAAASVILPGPNQAHSPKATPATYPTTTAPRRHRVTRSPSRKRHQELEPDRHEDRRKQRGARIAPSGRPGRSRSGRARRQ